MSEVGEVSFGEMSFGELSFGEWSVNPKSEHYCERLHVSRSKKR